jgi:hypothetical protein
MEKKTKTNEKSKISKKNSSLLECPKRLKSESNGEDDEDPEYHVDITMKNRSNIEYGNLIKSYDPKQSVTKTTSEKHHDLSSTNSHNNDEKEEEDYSYKVYCSLFKSDINSPLKKEETISLTRKSSLIKLIEQNRLNQICCPFDEIVYEQFKNVQNLKMKQILIDTVNKFELNDFKLGNNNSIDYLLPNCIATFLMPFFFDIFQPSDLKALSSSILEIVLKLKSNFKPEINLNSSLKITYILEDIMWNCFALFRFKFDKSFTVGFINYYISLFIIIKANEKDKYFQGLKLDIGIRKLAPYFIESLIFNGLFNQHDLKIFSSFNNSLTNSDTKQIVNEAFLIAQNKFQANCPIKLKQMCRIVIKNTMNQYNVRNVMDILELNDACKNFILFNNEFETYFNENRNLFENSNVKNSI